MDLWIALTIFGSVIAIISCNLAIFAWLKADITTNRTELSADRRDLLQILREIKEENKNFHGRLCEIEIRNRLEMK